MRVAIVHDLLLRYGGAERVVLALKEIYPEAPVYTLLYDRENMAPWFSEIDVRPSWLQKLPRFLRKKHKYLLKLMPLAVESLDLRDFDLVISSSTAFAKGVVTRPDTKHICYCHSPARFLWDMSHRYPKMQSLGGLRGLAAKISVHQLRLWDKSTINRVDYFIANSQTTKARIRKYYRRRAEVIYPPVPEGLESFAGGFAPEEKDYFLIVSQLVKHKNIEVAVEAFNKLELPLVVIGEGPERKRLAKLAGPKIKFKGFLPEERVQVYRKNCRAFIFPGEDDFGIAPVQALKAGRPVLALRAGGATETVIEGVNGEFFDWPLPEILADGVRRLLENYAAYDPEIIKKSVEKFGEKRFKEEIEGFVKKITVAEGEPRS